MQKTNSSTLLAFNTQLWEAVNNANTFIIYHKDCPDGSGSAALFYLKLLDLGFELSSQDARKGFVSLEKTSDNKKLRVEFLAREYSEGRSLPDMSQCNVIVVDFSLKTEPCTQNFHEVCQTALQVFWIDHHEGAWQQFEEDCAQYSNVPSNLHYLFDPSAAGVALANQVCYPSPSSPLLVAYLEDRDLNKWQLPHSQELLLGFDTLHATNDIVKYASAMALSLAATSARETNMYTTDGAQDLEEELYADYVQHGSIIIEVRKNMVAKACERAIPLILNGKKGYIVGMQRVMAHDAAMILASKDDAHFGAAFEIESHNRVKISFRGLNHHPYNSQRVLEYAKALGGGGHPFAAACYITMEQFSQLLSNSTN